MDIRDKVSVVVLSKNNASTLNECLKSISDSEGEKEIILVDAHSEDGTQEIIEKYRDNIKVIYDEGKGIGNARNLGIKSSKGEIICFVDADAKVSQDHFKKITKLFRSNLNVGMISVTPSHQIGKTKVQKLENLYNEVQKGRSRGKRGIR